MSKGSISRIIWGSTGRGFGATTSFALAFCFAAPRVASAVVLDHGRTSSVPVWVGDHGDCFDGSDAEVNSSFLNNYGPAAADSPLGDLISTKRAAEMRQDYILRTRDYEQRQAAGIVSNDLEATHTNDMRDFAQSVTNEVQSYQGTKAAARADAIAKENPDVAAAEKPAAVVGVLYGIYSDKTFSWHLHNETTLSGHTNLRAQTGTLALNSSVFTGAVDVDNHASDPWSPNPVVPDPTVGHERARLSVSKPIPALSMTSSLAYGTTSNAAIASLSRPIASHLTCVVDSVYPMDDMGGSRPAEQRLKFFYHFDF